MDTSPEFASLLKHVGRYRLEDEKDDRGKSRALLRWFLFNVFRLDETQSRDCVCDKDNDKGIDGLWVDEDTEEIFVFQAKYSESEANTLGDKELRQFVGSATWLLNTENIKKLMDSLANAELKALVSRYDLASKLDAGYEVRLVFATTRLADKNANEYLATLDGTRSQVDLWDRSRLLTQLTGLERKTRIAGKHKFTTTNPGFIHATRKGKKVFVMPVRALDVASMKGISDLSLFALNVRLGLGRTRVNRDLEKAIRDKEKHDQFMFYHNGVTVICRKFHPGKKSFEVEDFSIVNGCQSAIALHENMKYLSEDLLILARIIEVGTDDALAEDITYRTNNQNGINLRDLRSNDRIQTALKKQFAREYGGTVDYLIKAGETSTGGEAISNDRAGQLIMAFWLDEPYNAHQKYRPFGPEYERIFGRRVDAHWIYLAHILYAIVDEAVSLIQDPAIREYQLTRFILLGLLGNIMRRDPVGAAAINDPKLHLSTRKKALMQAAKTVISQMIPDINYYVKEKSGETGYFDYKSEFKSPEKYRSLKNDMERSYAKAVARHPEDSFEKAFSVALGP